MDTFYVQLEAHNIYRNGFRNPLSALRTPSVNPTLQKLHVQGSACQPLQQLQVTPTPRPMQGTVKATSEFDRV